MSVREPAPSGHVADRAAELVWHRGDLRLHDHAAVHAAAHSAAAVAGVVILDPAILDHTSARRRALFHENTRALRAAYEAAGSTLFVRRGTPAHELPKLARALRATRVHALRSHTPYGIARDGATTQVLRHADIPLHWHDGLYIQPPGTVLTRAGRPFSVYTPFAKRWHELDPGAELEPPTCLTAPAMTEPVGEIPGESSDVELPEPGENAALARMDAFVERRLQHYDDRRNRLDGSGTSRLSIDLTIGTLSARTVLYRIAAQRGAGARKLVGELAWRDFMADLLHHRPHLLERPFDERFSSFDWNDDEVLFQAWSNGTTGVPVVDAAMRELRATGWISNRARMVSAQFLTKHLGVDWRRGERLFRQLLLDGDTASNVGNWQWAAGLGVDNAPYFRVFNPVTQGREHDPGGAWIARWVPESFGDPRPLPHAVIDIAQARRDYLAAVESL
jgi:deoxyribodipyrimidine photo-lyase